MLDFPSAYIDDHAASQLPSVVLTHLCGESDEDVLKAVAEQDLVLRDFLYTLVVMCAPDEVDLAIAVNNLLVLDEIYEISKLLSDAGMTGDMDIETAVQMADRDDPMVVISSLIRNDWLGHVACGYMLRFMVSRWLNEDSRHLASIAQAANSVEEWCTVNGIYGGKKQNLTRVVWKKYGKVSHLWAAFHAMRDAELDPTTADGFLVFCGTAQWLLECGATIVPKGRRAGEAILRLDQAWTVPESHLHRGPDGTISTRVWSEELDVHDIRKTEAPPAAHPV